MHYLKDVAFNIRAGFCCQANYFGQFLFRKSDPFCNFLVYCIDHGVYFIRGISFQGTIHYIFSCDTETALEDAMQVVRTYQIEECDAYFFRIKSWIVNDKVGLTKCNRSLYSPTTISIYWRR